MTSQTIKSLSNCFSEGLTNVSDTEVSVRDKTKGCILLNGPVHPVAIGNAIENDFGNELYSKVPVGIHIKEGNYSIKSHNKWVK
jgi:hypothetical protein